MTTTSTIRFTCRGSVRGECGITHRSYAAAARHVERDRRVCATIGGGAYSDMRVVAVGADGYPIEAQAIVEDEWACVYE